MNGILLSWSIPTHLGDERFAFDPNFDEFGDYTKRAIQTLTISDDSSSTLIVEEPLLMIGLTSSCLRSVCSCALF